MHDRRPLPWRARAVLALTLVAAAGWWSPPAKEPVEAPAASIAAKERSPHYLKIGRWNGRVVERGDASVRYRFESPGEASVIVELAPRRPEHDPNYGTAAIAVEPVDGADVDPQLLAALTAWLRGDEPGAASARRPKTEAAPEASPSLLTEPTVRGLGKSALSLWALAGLAALALGRRREREASVPTSSQAPPKWWARTSVLALAVAALAIGLRLALAAPSPLDDDGLRDIGAGLVCSLGPCPAGADASFGDLDHGTGFVRLIGLCFDLGLGVGGVQVVLIALFGLAVGLTFAAGRVLGGPELGLRVGALAAAVELALLFAELSSTGEILWHPAAMALPAAAFEAALVYAATTGRAGPFLLAGVAAGVCFEAHLSGLGVWPALVVVAFATAADLRRSADAGPLIDRHLIGLAALAGGLAIPMLLSPQTVLVDGRAIVERLGVLGLGLAALGCVGLGLGLRRVLDGRARAWASALALAAPMLSVLGALALSGDFVESWPIRYVAALFPALALALAWALALGLRRVEAPRTRAAASAAVAALILVPALLAYVARAKIDRQRWTHADVDAIAEVLREAGVGRDQIHLALRGFACGADSFGDRGQALSEVLLGGLRVLGALDPRARAEPTPVWFIAKLANAALPELPPDAITLASGPEHTLVLAAHDPVLDLASARHCVRLASGASRCVAASLEPASLADRHVLPRHELITDPDIVESRYEIPLHPVTAARRTRVWIAALESSPRWRIVDAGGANTSELPAPWVELDLEPGPPRTLVLAREVRRGETLQPWWPPLFELPDDPGLRAIYMR